METCRAPLPYLAAELSLERGGPSLSLRSVSYAVLPLCSLPRFASVHLPVYHGVMVCLPEEGTANVEDEKRPLLVQAAEKVEEDERTAIVILEPSSCDDHWRRHISTESRALAKLGVPIALNTLSRYERQETEEQKQPWEEREFSLFSLIISSYPFLSDTTFFPVRHRYYILNNFWLCCLCLI